MQITKGKIVLKKELNKMDRFVLDFVKVLKKHSQYVLISGYVAILFGRSRISEDIDILMPKMDSKSFTVLYRDLCRSFWCLNGADKKELYDMLETGHSIRFGKKKKVIPNMELKFMKNKVDEITFREKIQVHLGKNMLLVSPIELQIAYKENILKSDKDMEDALHLREVFKEHLDKEKVKYYEHLVKQYG